MPIYNYALMAFLSSRCDAAFLQAFVVAKPEILAISSWIHVPLGESMGYQLLAALQRARCLPEPSRAEAVKRIDEATMDWMDPAVFIRSHLRDLLTDTEFGDLEARFKAEWMDDPRASFDRWRDQYSSSDELASHNDFKYNFELLRKRFSDEHTDEAFAEVLAELEQIIRQIEEEEPEPPPRTNLAVPRGQPAGPATDIFDDVDS